MIRRTEAFRETSASAEYNQATADGSRPGVFYTPIPDATKFMANEQIDEHGATAEIERYMAVPGQALSYKIGALKIRELRNKYQQQLGDKFNIAAFHDEVLKDGCMPLDVLEKKMDDWAVKQQ